MITTLLSLVLSLPIDTNVDMSNPLGLENPAALKGAQYQPAGCVQASFKVDNLGKAFDINMDRHYPENAFTNNAYQNILKMKHEPAQSGNRKQIYLQFQNNSAWPMPFECLSLSGQANKLVEINEQFLQKAELKEIKEAIDSRLFGTLFNSFNVTTGAPLITKNSGKYSATINVKWTSNFTEAYNLISHYIAPTIGSTDGAKLQTAKLDVARFINAENIKLSREILNYIGQRTMLIEMKISNGETKNIVLGGAINETTFCNGELAKTTSFNTYCVTFKNEEGTNVTFENLTKEEAENLKTQTSFKIKNSYLRD